jgi:hypothetical protein
MGQLQHPRAGGSSETPGASALPSPQVPRRRSVVRGFFRGIGWVGSTPLHWLGVGRIRGSASFISDQVEWVWARPERDTRFKTAEGGVFDLRATAFSHGIRVAELERRLLAQRRQTAVMAYVMGGLGVGFFAAWLVKVLMTPETGGRILLAFDFLPLCLLLVLVGFYQALLNYQIWTGRTAGWREYLAARDRFWPRS